MATSSPLVSDNYSSQLDHNNEFQLKNLFACISQELHFSAQSKSEFQLKNLLACILQKSRFSAWPLKKHKKITFATSYLLHILTSMGYQGERTKFFFLLPLSKENPLLFPHHDSTSKPTVSVNLKPIRTALFLSSTLQVGEQKNTLQSTTL